MFAPLPCHPPSSGPLPVCSSMLYYLLQRQITPILHQPAHCWSGPVSLLQSDRGGGGGGGGGGGEKKKLGRRGGCICLSSAVGPAVGTPYLPLRGVGGWC